jgi:ABC-type branched-subunit amino acid transport system ATPase component
VAILELDKVSKFFGGVKAVDDLSLGFEAGRITGLIGPNGAGKTTVFHMITGVLTPDEGRILWKGERIGGLDPWSIAAKGIGRLFQDVRVFDKMTVLQNVMVAFNGNRRENPLASVFARRSVLREEAVIRDKALELLGFVELSGMEDTLAENLSYGQQKLLAIARLLAADAEMLLLDEPTAGVNPTLARKLLEFIRELAKRGKTVVVIEHNMNVIMEVCDWAFFMDDGKLLSFGLPKDVLGNKEIRAAYMGL